MLRLAMKAIPLRHDAEPLEILFEDEHLLALNKPPGVLTAPKHRYMVRPSCSYHCPAQKQKWANPLQGDVVMPVGP